MILYIIIEKPLLYFYKSVVEAEINSVVLRALRTPEVL